MISCHFLSSHASISQIYTLSLHDALPISALGGAVELRQRHPAETDRLVEHTGLSEPVLARRRVHDHQRLVRRPRELSRSEEHTSELQSPYELVCRLLLEKKKKLVNSAQQT